MLVLKLCLFISFGTIYTISPHNTLSEKENIYHYIFYRKIFIITLFNIYFSHSFSYKIIKFCRKFWAQIYRLLGKLSFAVPSRSSIVLPRLFAYNPCLFLQNTILQYKWRCFKKTRPQCLRI